MKLSKTVLFFMCLNLLISCSSTGKRTPSSETPKLGCMVLNSSNESMTPSVSVDLATISEKEATLTQVEGGEKITVHVAFLDYYNSKNIYALRIKSKGVLVAEAAGTGAGVFSVKTPSVTVLCREAVLE